MKIQYKLLSYALGANTHGYGGEKPIGIKQNKAISKGDSCNTFILNFPNHIGTHIDCPNHFFNSGRKIAEYKIKDFIFLRPVLIDCPKLANELVTNLDIERNIKRLRRADIVLFRTGFYRYRGESKYSTENPGISPEAAFFLRRNLQNIRCVGIDAISVSPYQNRGLGRKTHAIFFKNIFKSRPPCLIEDMNLSGRLDNLKAVCVAPLFIKGVDSAPCTVFGILRR